MARVALINAAGVNQGRIARTVEAADLPSGHIRLIVGDPKLTPDLQAVTFPRSFIRYAGNLYGLEDHLMEPWDCGVSIGEAWASKEWEYPAYFSYLLAHELGHATTALTNLGLTLYEDLILQGMRQIGNDRPWRWDEMPHEIRYDQFGAAVAQEVHGRERLEAEVKEILDHGLASDEPRLHRLLQMPPRKDLVGLCEDLAEFSRPYRRQLVDLWSSARVSGSLRIADGLQDLEALWVEEKGEGKLA